MFSSFFAALAFHIKKLLFIFISILIVLLLILNLIPSALFSPNGESLKESYPHDKNNVLLNDNVSSDTSDITDITISHINQTNIAETMDVKHEIDTEIKTTDTDKYIQLLQDKNIIRSEKLNTGNKKYEINNKFIIHIDDRLLTYDLCQTAKGYGNGLSVYWGARSIAFWINFKFAIRCKEYYNNLDKHGLMSAFYPSQIDITSSNDKKNEIYYPLFDRTPKVHAVIHTTSLILLYYNEYFQKVMHSETKKALIDYYTFNNKLSDDKLEMEDKMHQNNDIVIHIRCGDVLQIMHRVKDWDYGFMTLQYYQHIINITNWRSKITENTTIYVISQLSKKAARKGEVSAISDCNILINYIVDNGLNKMFEPGKVEIMYDTDVNDDYYRMINTPFLICSPSTFCFNAAASNRNAKHVIIPNRGAWFNFIHIDPNYDKTDNNNDYIIAKNSDLIPSNQIIIDTDIMTNFHCNKIPYKSNGNSYNQAQYTKQLGEYLVTH